MSEFCLLHARWQMTDFCFLHPMAAGRALKRALGLYTIYIYIDMYIYMSPDADLLEPLAHALCAALGAHLGGPALGAKVGRVERFHESGWLDLLLA